MSCADLQDEVRKDSFLCWFILAIVSHEKDFEDLIGKDPKRVSVKLLVNGRELDAKPTLERLGNEVDRLIAEKSKEAARLLVDDTIEKLRAAIRERLGIEIEQEP